MTTPITTTTQLATPDPSPTARIDGHWIVEDVKEHTCGAGPGSGAGHEPDCGTIPLVDLSALPGWDTLVSDVLTDTSPVKPDPAVASRVTKRLTDAWGWLPDEPEAVTLGTNFARSAYLLVAGTRTTPDNLLDALIDGPTEAAPTVKPGRDEIARTIDPRPWSERHMPFRDFAEARTTAELVERDRESVRRIADAVLAILPGKTIAQVRAEALRDAAIALYADETAEPGTTKELNHSIYAAWLYARADEEAGK